MKWMFALLFPLTLFATEYYLDGNIEAGRDRFFKLDDGSYWAIKLEHGYFSCDHATGSSWWRFDPIDVIPGEDPCYPYQFTNRRTKETLACKQVDPALPASTGSPITILVQYSCTPAKIAYSPYFLNSNVYAKRHRFFRLDDGSYWEARLDNRFFAKDMTTGAFWRRGDQIKIECSDVPEFPYYLVNQKLEESLLCRQVDPALPESTHTTLVVEKEQESGHTDSDESN